MNKRLVSAAVYLCIIVIVLVAGWAAYKYFYGIPEGPVLPPQSPDEQYSEQVIDLNNEAVALQLEDHEKALVLYDKAIEIDPTYHLAYANKAQTLLIQKRYEEAAVCFETLVALRPRAAEYYVGQAFCLQRLGQPKEARSCLMYALSAYNYRLDADPVHARLNRALVLFLMGKKRVAKKELKEMERADIEVSKFAAALLQSMEDAEKSDPWLVLGLDK